MLLQQQLLVHTVGGDDGQQVEKHEGSEEGFTKQDGRKLEHSQQEDFFSDLQQLQSNIFMQE